MVRCKVEVRDAHLQRFQAIAHVLKWLERNCIYIYIYIFTYNGVRSIPDHVSSPKYFL